MDQSSAEHWTSQHSRPVLVELPSDIFIQILDTLSSRDAFRLSFVCKAFRSAPLILTAIYAEPFTKEDFEKRYILPESHSTETSARRDNYDSIVAHYHGFNSTLNEHTGSFVRHLTLWRESCRNCLLRYQELCPHVCSIDFTGFYGISSAFVLHRVVRNSTGDDDTPAPTHWDGLLGYTSLLSRLTSIRLHFNGLDLEENTPRSHAEWLGSQFPTLLKTAQNLKSIEIVGGDNRLDHYWVDLSSFDYLRKAMLCDAGPSLQILGLRDLHGTVRSLKMFLEPLKDLSQLKTIALSINANLSFVDRERYMPEAWDVVETPPNNQVEVLIQRNTKRNVEGYLDDLQSVTANPRWNIVCLDSPEDHPLDPRAFFPLIWKGKDYHLDWLHRRFSWNPVFTWRYNMRVEEELVDEYDSDDPRQPEQPLQWISPQKQEMAIASCRAVFRAIKAIDAPVQLLLPGNEYNGMLFDLTSGLNTPTHAEDWYLHRIGDLVDDLRMIWGGDAPNYTRGFVNAGRTVENLRDDVSRRIEWEKEGLHSLWRDFAQIFPNIKRLQLHMPSDLYPAKADDDFITTILPGKGWYVKRRKDEYNRIKFRTYFSRTFVREATGGEVDAAVTSTAALES